MDRTFHRLADVGNATAGPDTQLVPKQPEPARPACPNGTFPNNTAIRTVAGPDRSRLDCVPAAR